MNEPRDQTVWQLYHTFIQIYILCTSGNLFDTDNVQDNNARNMEIVASNIW
jgi:hypothetical protein